MKTPLRFSAPAWDLNLHSLLRETGRATLISLGMAVLVHASLVRISSFGKEHSTAKPLTTRFVKREPRLTKPLEMKKEPRPKRRRMKRTMVSVRPQVGPQGTTVPMQPPQLLPILARPDVTVSRMHYTSVMEIEPQVRAGRIVGTREAKHVMDMSLEMLDVEALDYGRYRAMVIQDPSDKRNIRGFVHFSAFFLRDEFFPYYRDGSGELDVSSRIGGRVRRYQGLIRKLNEWTEIKANFLGQSTLDSRQLLRTPWVYLSLSQHPRLAYTEVEKSNVARYMLGGGFLMIYDYEGGRSRHFPTKTFVKKALATQGYDWGRDYIFERLPNEHGIFHCFFDFHDGPPQDPHPFANLTPYMSAIHRDSRIICLFTNQFYALFWDERTRMLRTSSGDIYFDKTRVYQIAVNTIIFALTQEGSIAQRIMDTFKGY